MADLLERIGIDPAVCGGKPGICGTRIWVALILDLPAGGMSEAEVLAENPQLTHEDVLAAIAFGAEAFPSPAVLRYIARKSRLPALVRRSEPQE